MELSILVAKIAAIIYLSVGLGVLFGQVNLKKLMKSFLDGAGLTFISGFFMIVLGSLLIQNHNFWVMNWTVLITIIGWAILIKGILFLLLPKLFLSFGEKFTTSKIWLGILTIVIGLILGYFGFMA